MTKLKEETNNISEYAYIIQIRYKFIKDIDI